MTANPESTAHGKIALWWHGLGASVLVVTVLVLTWRLTSIVAIPDRPVESEAKGRVGLGDFRDVTYYPVVAVREGINPYDCGKDPLPDGSPRYLQRYPTFNFFPLYSPLLFVLYFPFSLMPYELSAGVYVAVNLALAVVLAWTVMKLAGFQVNVGSVCLLTSLILATTPGRANFIGGENALPLALGTIGAVGLSRKRPWLAGLLLALTSLKPTFGLPLGVLLLARGDWKTVLLGWGLGGAIGVAGLLIVFSRSGDLPRMVEIIKANQQMAEAHPGVDARQSATRVDGASAIVRTLPAEWSASSSVAAFATLAILGIAGVGVFLLNRRVAAAGYELHAEEAERLSGSIICLTVVGCMYHLVYDALPLWLPVIWLLATRNASWPTISWRWRFVVGCLALMPMVNIFSTLVARRLGDLMASPGRIPQPLLEAAQTLAFTASGWCVLAAIVTMVVAAMIPARFEASSTRTG